MERLGFPEEVDALLQKARSVTWAHTLEDLEDMSCGTRENLAFRVDYPLPDGRIVHEADVVRVRNGISVNYAEAAMRRRDPDCLFVADERPSDKPRFEERFDIPFETVRRETLDWLAEQDLAVFAFEMGQPGIGGEALAICPANAGFFAFALGLLQGIVDLRTFEGAFHPVLVLFVAPPFRHTRFRGRQVVVHRRADIHEIYSYNLYPGPSAKKGVYGALINKGEAEEWITAHCSTVQVVTPYDNVVSFMHEGASGGGKSEMLQQPFRQPDGRLLLGRNTVTGEERMVELQRTCNLRPVCDDMGLCHPAYQEADGRLWLMDAEEAWFVRVDHIRAYGTEPDIERLTISPSQPLLFLNLDAVPGSTALIWEHTQDAPGQPCPNPRVIIPRRIVPNVLDEKVTIDYRSFGVRTPPCTAERPSYGILGLFHVLPPALAWLWRLASPRGYANPSVLDSDGMSSEGVGSYWPFATGRKVDQANLLLHQFQATPKTRFILIPNQHIGAWRTGFMPQWLVRDYLARRGQAPFQKGQLVPSRCPLLGHALHSITIEGSPIHRSFLQVDTQPEVGPAAYDAGAEILARFFREQIGKFMHPELDPVGRKIIECCLAGGSVTDYESLLPSSNA